MARLGGESMKVKQLLPIAGTLPFGISNPNTLTQLFSTFHLSNFKTMLKTINFSSQGMMLSCVYLAASLRAFREASNDFHVLFSKCKHRKPFKTKGAILPRSRKFRTDVTNCDKDLKQGASIRRQMIALIF